MDNFNNIIGDDQFHYIYLDSGQYLALTWIDSYIAQRVFHCRVTNVFGMLSVDSPTRYRFPSVPRDGGGGVTLGSTLQYQGCIMYIMDNVVLGLLDEARRLN